MPLLPLGLLVDAVTMMPQEQHDVDFASPASAPEAELDEVALSLDALLSSDEGPLTTPALSLAMDSYETSSNPDSKSYSSLDEWIESIREPSVTNDPPLINIGKGKDVHKTSRRSGMYQSKRNALRSSSDVTMDTDAIVEFSSSFSKTTHEAKSVRQVGSIFKFVGSGEWKLNGGFFQRFDYLFYCSLPIIVQFVLSQDIFFPDGRPACNIDGSMGLSATNSSICELSWTLNEAHIQLRVLVAFILGGFIGHAVKLWRERRTGFCELCGSFRNLVVQISSLIPISDNDDDEIMAERQTLTRWAILWYELVLLEARGEMKELLGEEYLESRNLLASNEWERMVDGDRITSVWYWIQQKAIDLRDKGIIESEERVQTLCTALQEIPTGLIGPFEEDTPLAYAFLVGLLVKLNILTYVAMKGVEWAIWYFESEGSIWREPKMYQDAVCAFLYIIILEMLYDVSVVLYNPFGDRLMDVPHEIAGSGVRNFAKQLGDGKYTRPSTMFSVDCKNGVFLQAVDGVEDVVEFEEQAICHRTRRQSSIICSRRRSSVLLR